MPWLIGIDEAGYGPNLGPFVMSSVAWHVPDTLVSADLWHVLRAVVRRAAGDDDRVVVDDSKAVHGGSGGLGALESNVVAAFDPWSGKDSPSLADHVESFCLASPNGPSGECWYTGRTTLPLSPPSDATSRGDRFRAACIDAGIRRGPLRSVVVCTPRFNSLLDEHDSKGAVLAVCLGELLSECRSTLDGDDALHFFVDKHGGRNFYSAMLQDAFTDGMVVAKQEGALKSVYELLGTTRPIHVTIQPRADSECFNVALASMASKYLRELFMIEFNAFWQRRVAGLTPTAGYPNDAVRFMNAIRPELAKLGLEESALWRRK